MGTVGVASWVAGAAERGEGANVRERQANGQPPEQPSYVAVEVPKGKAEGVVGGAGVLSFDDDDDGSGGRAGGRRALDAARSASRAARVSDAVRTDAPRVLASASAMDAALAAREAVRDGSAARCALVVDPDGSLRGVATARSMAAVIASGRGDAATAFEACDGDVPLVASSWTLREAEARMRARRVTLAAVVATVLDANESGEEKRAALGVLEAGAAAAERDAAALGAALRAHEAAAANGRKGAKGRGANVPR